MPILPIEIVGLIIEYIPFCKFCNIYKTKCTKSGSGDMVCYDCWCKNYKISL